jgi:hypothetical protein
VSLDNKHARGDVDMLLDDDQSDRMDIDGRIRVGCGGEAAIGKKKLERLGASSEDVIDGRECHSEAFDQEWWD